MKFLHKVTALQDMAGDPITNSMVFSQLGSICHHVEEIREHLTLNQNAPDWVKAKISTAADKLSDIAHYIMGLRENEDIRQENISEDEADGITYSGSLHKDVKGAEPGLKDIARIKDIVLKANGDKTKMLSLVNQMSQAIQDEDKAQRRASAALKVLPKDVGQQAAQIFLAKW